MSPEERARTMRDIILGVMSAGGPVPDDEWFASEIRAAVEEERGEIATKLAALADEGRDKGLFDSEAHFTLVAAATVIRARGKA